MGDSTTEIPGERPNGSGNQLPPERGATRSPAKQAVSRRRSDLGAARTQTVVLAYLVVLLVLGMIALLRAPGTDIPQVVVSLHSWLRM
jgi:hypothetical protein